MQQSLGRLQNLHECLFSLLYGPVKLLPRLILLNECICQHGKALAQLRDLGLYVLLFLLILRDLVVQVIPAYSDVLYVAGELAVVALEGGTLGELDLKLAI